MTATALLFTEAVAPAYVVWFRTSTLPEIVFMFAFEKPDGVELCASPSGSSRGARAGHVNGLSGIRRCRPLHRWRREMFV